MNKKFKRTRKFTTKELLALFSLGIVLLLTGCLSSPYSKQDIKEEQDWSWVPTNFEADLTSGKLAFRYLATKEATCKYNIPCLQIEVISKGGCETLYAQAPLIDSNGTNVGYANDLTKSVPANGRAILTFSNTAENAVSMQRPTFKCY